MKSRSVKNKNAETVRGAWERQGGVSLPFFPTPTPPFPSRARFIFALLVLIRPHYTISGSRESARYRSRPLRGLMVSTGAMEAFSRKDLRWSLSVKELVPLTLKRFSYLCVSDA